MPLLLYVIHPVQWQRLLALLWLHRLLLSSVNGTKNRRYYSRYHSDLSMLLLYSTLILIHSELITCKFASRFFFLWTQVSNLFSIADLFIVLCPLSNPSFREQIKRRLQRIPQFTWKLLSSAVWLPNLNSLVWLCDATMRREISFYDTRNTKTIYFTDADATQNP